MALKNQRKDLIRNGEFYDGNYFLHVSNYYNYYQSAEKRLNIAVFLHDLFGIWLPTRRGVDPNFQPVS
jgi:hypothetical protein